MSKSLAYGFIGLGRMGGPMAANLAKAGTPLAVHDIAGAEARAPGGARCLAGPGEIARACDAVFLSLPAGGDVHAVLAKLLTAPNPRMREVIDLSTIGVRAAEEVAARCARSGVAYHDAPVSGGRAGAVAATLSIMWAGPGARLEAHRPALAAMAKSVLHVGERPGQGQALKLLNNFLSATATAATAEALLFGRAHGLDLETVLGVVNVSTGRSDASERKFVRHVLTGTFDSGFGADQMAKDLGLYREALAAAGTAGAMGREVAALWRDAAAALDGGDHTRIFEFLAQANAS